MFTSAISSLFHAPESFTLKFGGRDNYPDSGGTTYTATAPLLVLSWDITYLPSQVRGQFFYLYLIEDIFSRKAVAWEVYESECGSHAAALLSERCLHQPLVLHSDNGAPMKSTTLLSKMNEHGVTPSCGRPRVSNDNAYSESLFRMLMTCLNSSDH